MGLRNLMQEKPAVGVVIVVAIVALAVFLATRGSSGPPVRAAMGLYYYDLGSGELFVASLDAVSPIDTDKGGQGVEAYVFTCTACEEGQWQVLYLEKLTAKARSEAVKDDVEEMASMNVISEGTMIAKPPAPGEEVQWVQQSSQAGVQLETAFLKLCDGGKASRCQP